MRQILLKGLFGISDFYRLLSIAIDYYRFSQLVTIDKNFFVSSIVIDYQFESISIGDQYRVILIVSIDFRLTTPGVYRDEHKNKHESIQITKSRSL